MDGSQQVSVVPRESVRDKLERFIENDFRHLAIDVANVKGQLKILLMICLLYTSPSPRD